MALLFEQIVENLTATGLISQPDLDAAIESLPTDLRSDTRALADALIQSGQLTRYQARAVYHGRVKSLLVRDYVVQERIGKGGMGQVFKARHRKLDRTVALKILDRQLARNPEFVKRFQRELRAVAKLSHPNIVRAYDAGRYRGRLYLAMEFIDGTDLRALLKSNGPVDVSRAVTYVLQAARGLEYAHQQGVVHRDVKPANLMLDRDGTVKILDFGLATFGTGSGGSSQLTSTGDVMGSVDFMSPEQFSDTRQADERSDIYSLGCVLHLLLTANPVFSGSSTVSKLAAHMHADVPSLQLKIPDAPEPLDSIFQRMLAKQPDERYQSMSELLQDLNSFAETIGLLLPDSTTTVSPDPTTSLKEPESTTAYDFEDDTPRSMQEETATRHIPSDWHLDSEKRSSPWKRTAAVCVILGAIALAVGGVLVAMLPNRADVDNSPDHVATATVPDIDPSLDQRQRPTDVPVPATLTEQAAATMRRATEYFHGQVATHGGYVYFYSPDLSERWGEGPATIDQIWVEPPATPTVGLAFVEAYRAAGDDLYLKAATDAADALIYGQLESGGWTNCVDFAPDGERTAQYRNGRGGGRNHSSLDDGQTQSAIRLLIHVDAAHGFRNATIHDAAQLALDALLAAQFPNGAFPQGFTGPVAPQPVFQAGYPDYDWETEGQIKEFWDMYTINDDVCGYAAQTLIDAHQYYGDARYLEALRRLGDFMIRAQMPDPQPGWAQQYNYEMKPIWGRKFEPPAVASEETQQVIDALMLVADATGDDRYLAPIPRALEWLRNSLLPDGRLARFYEFETNRPLYILRRGDDYTLTHDDSNLPGNYGWKITARLDELQRKFNMLRAGEGPRGDPPPTEDEIRAIVDSQDAEGRWLTSYAGELLVGDNRFQQGEQYLSSELFSANLTTLSRFVAGSNSTQTSEEPTLLVFVLAGQSNMGGVGRIEDLEVLAHDPKQAETFGRLKSPDGRWVTRDDVFIHRIAWDPRRGDYVYKHGALTVGFGEQSHQFGPELGFGNVIGDARDEPVLLIKVTQGPMSLAVEGRPPGSGGEVGPFYQRILDDVDATLRELDSRFPELSGYRPRLCGLVWFQGWNDFLNMKLIDEYDDNLRNLILDLRAAWGVPRMPVVFGEFGQHGVIELPARVDRRVRMRAAQQAVAALPEFQGNVTLVETVPYVQDGPGLPYRYGENAETFYRIGEAFGQAMLELLADSQR